MWISHRKEIRKLTFRALALRRTKLYFPPTQHHSFFRNLPLYIPSVDDFQIVLNGYFKTAAYLKTTITKLKATMQKQVSDILFEILWS